MKLVFAIIEGAALAALLFALIGIWSISPEFPLPYGA